MSLQRGVRQLLADKVSGSHLGLWLLVAEHLRLGTWDLLLDWTGQPSAHVEPRLALQLVHEAALCVAGIRANRSLPQAGFAVVNGLPFLASDLAIHQLLGSHTVQQAMQLQRDLGVCRWRLGHYAGRLLILDPHRVPSHSKRHMRRRRKTPSAKASKMSQTFFAIDGETRQPVCLTTSTASRTVTQATPELLALAGEILPAGAGKILGVADAEHFSAALLEQVRQGGRFDLLVSMILQEGELKRLRAMPEEVFTRRWSGYATLQRDYTPRKHACGEAYTQLVQRFGEGEECSYNAFVCTGKREELDLLTWAYPARWHAEEFFNLEQALGWERAGTQNVNIRYGQMTLTLVAQAVLHMLRQRLGEPVVTWDAPHLAKDLLAGLEGDVRVSENTLVVTFYNAPNVESLRRHYEHLPEKLRAENRSATIPWLYDFQLDFRFR